MVAFFSWLFLWKSSHFKDLQKLATSFEIRTLAGINDQGVSKFISETTKTHSTLN